MSRERALTRSAHRGLDHPAVTTLAVATLTALVALLMPASSFAATPTGATLSEASTTATWTGQPLPPTAAAECDGPNGADCDHFALSIVPPSYDAAVEITITAGPADDYDLEVYDPAGNLVASSGNAPGAAETATLVAPSAGTYTVSVANYAALTAYTGQAELVAATTPPGGAAGAGASFAIYPAPEGFGANAGEPSVGVNWNTDRVMSIAGLQTVRTTFDDCSSPSDAAWEDVSFALTSLTTLDPILFTDPRTGRTFASQLGPKCSSMAFTDDDGATWTPSQGCGINSGVDHQTVGGGPFAPPLVRDPDGPLYPHAVYYCSQDIAIAQCARSDTGGLTFAEATPIYAITECGGLHGHVKVAPNDGTVYVPNKGCNGEQAVALSEQNGLLGTWTVRRVPGTTSGEWDPSVGIGSDGTIYLGMTNGGRPMIAVSSDKGVTWSAPFDVGLGAGPNGLDILNVAFPVVVAGDGDRAAFGFLGAEQGGDGGGEDIDSGHVWYPYVATTTDRGVTWSISNLTPGDPVQRGTICSAGTTCGPTRNLLDFNDIQVDREGRVVFVYADGCVGGCVKGGPNSQTELLTLARQSGGPRLFAAFDGPDLPDAPRIDVTYTDAVEDEVAITWSEPDDHGSPIYEYRVYRYFEGDPGAEQIATILGGSTSYTDTVPVGSEPRYRVTAVNAFGEGASCRWIGPIAAAEPVDVCVEPGATVLTDAAGDALDMLPAHDVLSLSVSQPTDLADEAIVFTLQMAALSNPPPSTDWPVVFQSADGNDYFAKMTTDALGTVSFRVGPGADTTVDGALAHPASSFAADGTIRLVVPLSAIGDPQPGDQLSAFLTRIEIDAVALFVTPDNMPDNLARTGSYTLGDCGPATHCVDTALSDAFAQGPSDHALDLKGIGRDFVFESPGELIEAVDGTARLTGTLVDRFDAQKRFQLELHLADLTPTPPPGSPETELQGNAYVENGGPVDPATWRYYEHLFGTLTGEGAFDGALVRLFRRAEATQLGVGANGVNVVDGGAAWLSYGVEEQPTTGSLQSSGKGDLRVDLVCD